jgi:CheY-like chemotaxis protein
MYPDRNVRILTVNSEQIDQRAEVTLKNILVVDDSESFLRALADWLSMSAVNWRILAAENGSEALEILKSVQVDFIVTDLQMPVMDGYKLLACTSKNYPHIPAIAMTGSYTSEAKARLHALGVRKCMEKPFSFKLLEDAIIDEFALRTNAKTSIENCPSIV